MRPRYHRRRRRGVSFRRLRPSLSGEGDERRERVADTEFDERLRKSLAGAWHQYLVGLDPMRSDLFRYCRRLTGHLWDAEDLVQETLLRAFSGLSQVLHTIKNPRAYLLRIATNLWIDTLRARAVEQVALGAGGAPASALAASPPPPASESAEGRDAAAARG